MYNEKYCSDMENGRPLNVTRPVGERIPIDLSCWDVKNIRNLFIHTGIPFEIRDFDDPSPYACNGWIYRTLLAMRRQKATIPYLFLHTACTKEAIESISDFDTDKILIRQEDTLKALEIILQSYKVQEP